MSGSKGALAPFRMHDMVLELAQKNHIMHSEMARSAFDPDIIMFEASKVSCGEATCVICIMNRLCKLACESGSLCKFIMALCAM